VRTDPPLSEKHAATGLCLDHADGASQNYWLALTGYPNAQQYQVMASHTGKCLEPAGGSTSDFVQIVQNTCTAQPSQLWTFQPVASVLGGYRIVNVQSNKCMDVSGSSLSNGGQVLQVTCNGGTNQTWKARRRLIKSQFARSQNFGHHP